MKKLELGKIVDTHALKGELRIISDFDYKEKAFLQDQILFLEDDKTLTVDTYRIHKNFDMLKFKEINTYEDALALKNKIIYIDKESLNLKEDEYSLEELITFSVIINNKKLGEIVAFKEIGLKKKLIVISDNKKEYYYPYAKELILKVDSAKREINLEYIEGLIK